MQQSSVPFCLRRSSHHRIASRQFISIFCFWVGTGLLSEGVVFFGLFELEKVSAITQLNLRQILFVWLLRKMDLKFVVETKRAPGIWLQNLKESCTTYALGEMCATKFLPPYCWNGFGNSTWLTIVGIDRDDMGSDGGRERKHAHSKVRKEPQIWHFKPIEFSLWEKYLNPFDLQRWWRYLPRRNKFFFWCSMIGTPEYRESRCETCTPF